jgi:hypothetical protein
MVDSIGERCTTVVADSFGKSAQLRIPDPSGNLQTRLACPTCPKLQTGRCRVTSRQLFAFSCFCNDSSSISCRHLQSADSLSLFR